MGGAAITALGNRFNMAFAAGANLDARKAAVVSFYTARVD
jgi:hypothetical protein